MTTNQQVVPSEWRRCRSLLSARSGSGPWRQMPGHGFRMWGACGWFVARDPDNKERHIEAFMAESWMDYLRQLERMTNADHATEDHGGWLILPIAFTYLFAAQEEGYDAGDIRIS